MSLGTPKGLEEHRKKTVCRWQNNSFPGDRKHLHKSCPDQEHPPWGRCIWCKRKDANVNTEGTAHDCPFMAANGTGFLAGWILKSIWLDYLLRFNQMLQNSQGVASQCRWITYFKSSPKKKKSVSYRYGFQCKGLACLTGITPEPALYLAVSEPITGVYFAILGYGCHVYMVGLVTRRLLDIPH